MASRTSDFLGVSWHRRDGKWRVRIDVDVVPLMTIAASHLRCALAQPTPVYCDEVSPAALRCATSLALCDRPSAHPLLPVPPPAKSRRLRRRVRLS